MSTAHYYYTNTTDGSTKLGGWIVSGGFSDEDWINPSSRKWLNFPIYELKVSSSSSNNRSDDCDSSDYDKNDSTRKKKYNIPQNHSWWRILTLDGVKISLHGDNPRKTVPPIRPLGRVGHVSAVIDGRLYVYGGLFYGKEKYHRADGGRGGDSRGGLTQAVWSVEDNARGIVWSADISGFLNVDREDENVATKEKTRILHDYNDPRAPTFSNGYLVWEKHIASENHKHHKSSSEAKSVPLPRGETAGGSWRNRLVFYGGLHILPQQENETNTDPLSQKSYVNSSLSKMKWINSWIFAGSTATKTTFQNRLQNRQKLRPMGDVWSYDVHRHEFELLYDCVESSSQVQGSSLGPPPRISHAATIMGDILVIHGGRSWDTKKGRWEVMGDLWEFDLVRRVWRERPMFPKLLRSYHSLVTYGDDLVIFGGYRNAISLMGRVSFAPL
eukprot:CAMPEP_0113308964 /NCGR_PEP_ID=MMETSP0010_2-20120614/7204_1 /TAXON_ID=216773 ORGANISM="Corethron hystrix, Strain 308" /NCGR_SAMPLE_ID=MMETSP0010_2 /ASSEMBLY_ACC=CAM_ASM_000155 /LENGTH=441 /DNA_ID=CAMNT_0000164135 /DNA_START=277 /DNA_END=1602 /DNA_ORIENTATION=- /assembly_acc=CAM_ASM_000155